MNNKFTIKECPTCGGNAIKKVKKNSSTFIRAKNIPSPHWNITSARIAGKKHMTVMQ